MTDESRTARLGTELDCPLCDRAELPDALHVSRTAGPFDATTLPSGLRKAHRVADGVWGRLRVTEGSAAIALDTRPPLHVRLAAGDSQPIPPGVPHAVSVDGPVVLVIDFLVRDAMRPEG